MKVGHSERLKNMPAFACHFHTYNHIFQGVFGKPAVQKDWDKEIPQGRPEYLKNKSTLNFYLKAKNHIQQTEKKCNTEKKMLLKTI